MHARTWSLFVAGVVLGASLSAVGCAGKSKVESTPTPAPKAAPPPAPPPETLTMKVDATPPAPPAPPPVPVADPCTILRDRLASTHAHFELDRATLNSSAVAEVDAINGAIRSSGLGPGLDVSIEGHCDATGTDEYNIALSDRRAKTVLDRLVTLGTINPMHAKTVPWGKQKPLDPGSTPEAYAKNRRVEILVNCPAH